MNINNKICGLYKNGNTQPKIAKIVGLSQAQISRILSKNKIKIRPNRGNLKYQINDKYFDKINSIEKAYFLGLLYADGTNKQCKAFSITLIEKDKHILDKFAKALYKDKYHIRTTKSKSISQNNFCCLYVSNKKLSKQLNNLGCVPNKSVKGLFFPKENILPKRFIPYFIRGYFDGDGSVFVKKRDDKLGVSFVGCEKFIDSLRKYLITNNIRTGNICGTSSAITKEIKIDSKDSIFNFYNFIYKNSNDLFLIRKKDKFDAYYKRRNYIG
jgi:intein-encoded DNA endonuclease-like protein